MNQRTNQSDTGVGTPPRPSSKVSIRLEGIVDSFARTVLLEPRRATPFFWGVIAVAVLVTIPLVRWSTKPLVTLFVVFGICAVALVTRLVIKQSSPYWTLHIDVGVASVLASVLAWTGAAKGVGFTNIYFWIAIYVAVYFRPFGAMLHIGFAGFCYAVALDLEPTGTHQVTAWFAVIGTASVAAVFVLGLINILRSTSRVDALTGLANRRFFDERFEEELERARRSGDSLSVALIDIDDFKVVNDRRGHEAGDQLLIELGARWQAVMRERGDILGRIGGDEFAVLAPGSDSLGVRRLSERLMGTLPEGVSVSIGTATWDRIESAADLMRKSDKEMYLTKLRHRVEALHPRD